MRRWLIKWLGGVTVDEHLATVKTIQECFKLQLDVDKVNDANINALKLSTVMIDRKFELILKHGCLDCFSLDGELHKDNCQYGHTLVRRDNGRPVAGN